jgi:hypothetical protein
MLRSFDCKYLRQEHDSQLDTVLIGDDFILPDKGISIGNQRWRWNYKSFLTIESTHAWMLKNGYNCLIFDEDSLEGRIPSIDGDSFIKEYKQGRYFKRRSKIKSGQTLVFKLK